MPNTSLKYKYHNINNCRILQFNYLWYDLNVLGHFKKIFQRPGENKQENVNKILQFKHSNFLITVCCLKKTPDFLVVSNVIWQFERIPLKINLNLNMDAVYATSKILIRGGGAQVLNFLILSSPYPKFLKINFIK